MTDIMLIPFPEIEELPYGKFILRFYKEINPKTNKPIWKSENISLEYMEDLKKEFNNE